MQWGNFSITQVNMKKKKVEFLLPPETNIDRGGGQNLTPGIWLESATL